jgi:hypothetical protein
MNRMKPSMDKRSANNNGAENAPKGRDTKGRFTTGNKGGPGNPFAANVAKLRQAALEIVTPQEIQGVFRVLLLRAQTGHLASIKLLLAYTIGQPAATVDPDEIDLPDEPPPPPVVEEEEEEDEDDFDEPQVEEENPGPARVDMILQALTAALTAVPQDVRDELASRFQDEPQAAAEPQPAPEPPRKPAQPGTQPLAEQTPGRPESPRRRTGNEAARGHRRQDSKTPGSGGTGSGDKPAPQEADGVEGNGSP